MHHIREEDMVLLTALLDGALNPQESATLRQRLATDHVLHEAYLDLELIRDQLNHLPPVQLPRSLRLDDGAFTRARGWRWWLTLPPGGVLTPAFGAVASIVVVVFFVQSLLAQRMPVEPMMMAVPAAESFMLEEAPAAQSRMLESAPVIESAPASEGAPMIADSAPASEDASLMAAPELAAPAEPMPLSDMGYQQYGDVWFNWAIAGVVVSAIACALSLRWLIQVWWRRRHQRS
ncbi:MAG: hypothetical protein ACK5GU_08160 [Chloroflexota bacterium]